MPDPTPNEATEAKTDDGIHDGRCEYPNAEAPCDCPMRRIATLEAQLAEASADARRNSLDCQAARMRATEAEARLAAVERERDHALRQKDAAEEKAEELRACGESQTEEACGACLACAAVGAEHSRQMRVEAEEQNRYEVQRADAAEARLAEAERRVEEKDREIDHVQRTMIEHCADEAERVHDGGGSALAAATMIRRCQPFRTASQRRAALAPASTDEDHAAPPAIRATTVAEIERQARAEAIEQSARRVEANPPHFNRNDHAEAIRALAAPKAEAPIPEAKYEPPKNAAVCNHGRCCSTHCLDCGIAPEPAKPEFAASLREHSTVQPERKPDAKPEAKATESGQTAAMKPGCGKVIPMGLGTCGVNGAYCGACLDRVLGPPSGNFPPPPKPDAGEARGEEPSHQCENPRCVSWGCAKHDAADVPMPTLGQEFGRGGRPQPPPPWEAEIERLRAELAEVREHALAQVEELRACIRQAEGEADAEERRAVAAEAEAKRYREALEQALNESVDENFLSSRAILRAALAQPAKGDK